MRLRPLFSTQSEEDSLDDDEAKKKFRFFMGSLLTNVGSPSLKSMSVSSVKLGDIL